MAIAVAKRTRRSELAQEEPGDQYSGNDDDQSDPHAPFRKHFEAQFEPLPELRPAPILLVEDGEEEAGDRDSGSDWNGLSDEDAPVAELIQYTASRPTRPEMTKEEYRTFMTSKPPLATTLHLAKTKQNLANEPDALTEAANLKKDLALQRLLKESHLLSPSSLSSSLSHSGANRHRALDMRLQDMGSKSSIFKQENMPLAQRKGITGKAKEREEARRKEAFENGIVLEKAERKKRSNSMRERGVGAPAVGKFHGGTLKLSRKDIAEIEGVRRRSVGGKRGKR